MIVNSKKQAIAKKGYEFMDEQDRKKIIKALKCVDMAIISIDRDASVCETIRAIAKANLGDDFIFAKGGDRKAGELLEDGVCAEYGIKVVSGLGEKIRSSSEMVKNAKEKSD
jgi:glycerol-3-phosphate cytidylyltransferase-like family protein